MTKKAWKPRDDIEFGTPGNWYDTICGRCGKPVSVFISNGLTGDGGEFFQLHVRPCLNCLNHEDIKSRADALYELYETRTSRNR